MSIFNIEKYNTEDFNATYSPEDNKLRLYTDVRIDQDDWLAMKNHGWKWAPKQELFVCYWSVNNEDFCLTLAGDILPEEMTIVERAEAKADRLLLLAQKRSNQCVGYQKAANDLMLRIDSNQPILNGHHSQRKAEKTQLKVERTIEKAKDTAQAVGYWVWRAKGVIGHANYKNNSRTIYNRIKTLSKDLRDNQRVINSAASTINTITFIKNQPLDDMKKRAVSFLCCDWSVSKFNINDKIKNEEITHNQALDELLVIYHNTVNSVKRARVINHILNRLAYEQGQLSTVSVYDGLITAPVIQTFLRSQGAEKPKAEKTDHGWLAVSSVCLPLHVASSNKLELDDQEWCDLMVSVGYEVPVKRTVTSKPPIMNFKTGKTFTYNRGYQPKELEQVDQTKAEYKANGSDFNCTCLSPCKTFRFRVGFVKNNKGGHDWKAVFITDSKVHETPDSFLTVEA